LKQLRDTVWQRRGVSWIWDAEALNQVAAPGEAVSLRQFLRLVGNWSDELPSNKGNALLVAGLDGGLDLLSPADADKWLGNSFKEAVLSFQDFYQGGAALVFWMPEGQRRFKVQTASDAVLWRCAAPHHDDHLDFSRLLWGEAGECPQEILLPGSSKPAGLFHLRIT
jgi:hypothetical protein